jgi:hypothetical protein
MLLQRAEPAGIAGGGFQSLAALLVGYSDVGLPALRP